MLDVFIIEEIKRRDRGRSVDERPVIELPLPAPPPRAPTHRDELPRPGRDRGVVIIDYGM